DGIRKCRIDQTCRLQFGAKESMRHVTDEFRRQISSAKWYDHILSEKTTERGTECQRTKHLRQALIDSPPPVNAIQSVVEFPVCVQQPISPKHIQGTGNIRQFQIILGNGISQISHT